MRANHLNQPASKRERTFYDYSCQYIIAEDESGREAPGKRRAGRKQPRDAPARSHMRASKLRAPLRAARLEVVASREGSQRAYAHHRAADGDITCGVRMILEQRMVR